MSAGVVPAKVLLFEKSGTTRVQPPGALARRDGTLAVPVSWLNAVKAQYTRTLREEDYGRIDSLALLPVLVQTAIAEWFGQAWRKAKVYRIPVGLRYTVGACALIESTGLLELCIYTESAAFLAAGHARPGDKRFTWKRE